MSKKFIVLYLLLAFAISSIATAQPFTLKESFSTPQQALKVVGRGECKIEDGVLRSKDAYACFGDSEWKNYSVSFKARAPEDAEQVQIWAGFRAYNRFDRYIVGLRGGLQDNLYLSRMGYMGADEMLGLRTLDFHPVPGTWYNLKIEVCGDRIRIFLNNESVPRMDVTDKNAYLAPAGEVTLGGSWIKTEFDDLTIAPLNDDQLANIPVQEYKKEKTDQQKEQQRIEERAEYKPLVISKLNEGRTTVSLDGTWLFMPEYQLQDKQKAIATATNDEDWHTLNVPNFWNPIRIWLHGETFGSFSKGVSDRYYEKETQRCENYTFDYKQTKAAWYRQWVELPANIRSKRIELNFDAVSKIAEVYINGTFAGSHVGMFGNFSIDGSPLFKPGKNLIAVKVIRDYVKDIQDADKVVDVAVTVPVTNKMLKDIAHGFYDDDPAGIWQPVEMVITNPARIEDVFIKPALDGASFEITVKNDAPVNTKFNLLTDIIEKSTGKRFATVEPQNNINLNPGEERVITYSVSNLKPRLWTPQHPNLYDFNFRLAINNKDFDQLTVCSGFRTFESKNGLLYLNGIPYWLRGGNQTPFALAPNDKNLADAFYQLMKAGNMEVTRTHNSPYNELWIDAADRNGVGISFEGTWPWLMIQQSMPDTLLIHLWANEYLDLLKKYRNHPSILIWTVNNEMKFYDNDPNIERAKQKMHIISDVVKRMRAIDPTRPVCFDSNYRRNAKRFGEEFYKDIDDGDIDDVHAYYNWYDYTIFNFFKGEFQKNYKNPGRPLISQEMSTGYPNNDTGHATRFYNLVHQNPQSLIGYQSYEYADPNAFLNVQAFITGELAEAFRRSCDQSSGILHFAISTWFRNVYDAKNIEPYPAYYALKRALQPVLVSAEIWGRHFYAGEKLPVQLYVVNDREDGKDLKPSFLLWELTAETGEKIADGKIPFPAVKHYTRQIVAPDIRIPSRLPNVKTPSVLKLRLIEQGVQISENEYKILLAEKAWTQVVVPSTEKIVFSGFDETKKTLDFMNINYSNGNTITEALKMKSDVCILSGLDRHCSDEEIRQIRSYISGGGKVLISDSPETVQKIFPEYINGFMIPAEGDIVNMEIPESPVFDGIGLLELRYFNNNERTIPTVCHSALKINRNPNVTELANQTKIHGYINGTMDQRSEYIKTIKGFPLIEIKDNQGVALISTMAVDKAATDPVAGKLMANMINCLSKSFVHPGMAQTGEDMEYMKEMIAKGIEPWKTAFENLKKETNPDFKVQAVSYVSVGPYGANSIGGKEFSESSSAAYNNALMWYITKNKIYADKAIEILNAWSYKLKSFDGNNAKLNVGLFGYYYMNAAEILKYTGSGWNEKDQEQFQRMALTVFYPSIEDFFTEANGNWDASIISTMLCIGVFTNNREIFNRALERYYHGECNSGIIKYIYPGGQCQEAMRDWGHVQLGIGEYGKAAQTAYNQGVDLYSVAEDRLAQGYEKTAQMLLEKNIDIYGVLSKRAAEKFSDMYEAIYDHYKNVKGIDLPYSGKAIFLHTRPKSSIGFLTGVRKPAENSSGKLKPLIIPEYLLPTQTGALDEPAVKISADSVVMVNPGDSIQDAIDKNRGNGKKIVLSKGVHTLRAPLKLYSGTFLSGMGKETILILSPEMRTETIINGERNMHDVVIRDLLIEGATSFKLNEDPNSDRRGRSYMYTASREGIVFRSEMGDAVKNILFENVTVQNFTKNGVLIDGGSNIKISRCDFSDNGSSVVPGAGYHHNLKLSYVADCEILRSRFDTSPWGNGIYISFGKNVILSGNETARNKLSGIYCAESENITISGNRTEGNDKSGICIDTLMDSCKSVMLQDNFSQGNGDN